MSNLAVRILFALGATPVIFFLLYWSYETRVGMMALFIGIGAWEWSRMVAAKIEGPRMRLATPVSAILLTLAWAYDDKLPGLMLIVACEVVALYLAAGFARVKIDNLFPWIALHAMAPLYLGLWGGMSLKLMGQGRGFESSAPFLVVMVSMWVCDTFAYFTGRLLGKHKLAPEISPKKTWEGAIGGAVFTMAFVAWLGPWAFGTGLAANLAMGLLFAVSGQAGDLMESALKRWAGFKDSSRVFPGHGGVLDRLDSLFLSAPLAAVVLQVFRG